MTRRQRAYVSVFGGGVGLAFGVVWYFAWGCRHCAVGTTVVPVVVFATFVGVLLANVWGPDHLRR